MNHLTDKTGRPAKGLTESVLSAVKSNYLGTVVRVLAQLVAQVSIMRMLGPELIGTFGYVLLFNGVLALVIDQGFGWSLIQGDFSDGEIAVAYSRMMAAGLVCMGGVFAVSYPLSVLLNDPLAGSVIRWSSPAYLLIGLYAASHARLRRDLRFTELQYATTGAYLVAYPGVGLTMAWLGCGVWSLLAAWYVQALLQILVGRYFASHPLRLVNPFKPCQASRLGHSVAGINLLNWGVDNSSGVFVGTMSAAALGNFNAASVLARQPALQLVQTLQGLLFSAASALEQDGARVRQLYISAMAVVSLAVCPLYGYILTHADFLVALVFGRKWASAGGILEALSLGMAVMALGTVTGSVLTATGRQRVVVLSQAICLVFMAGGTWWGSGHSVLAVAWMVSIAYALRFLVQQTVLVRQKMVSARDLVVTLRGPLALSLLAGMPLPQWVHPTGTVPGDEALGLALRLVLALALIKLRPQFFVSPACAVVLSRLPLGRRILAALGLLDAKP